MKQIKYIVLVLCIIAFAACSSDDDATVDTTTTVNDIDCDTSFILQFEEV